MQFLLNDQFALNAKRQTENEQKGEKHKNKWKKTQNTKEQVKYLQEKRTNRFIYNFRLKLKAL